MLAAALLLLAAAGESIVLDGRLVAGKSLPEAVPAKIRATALRHEAWAAKHALRIRISATDPLVFIAPASFAGTASVLSKLRPELDDFKKSYGAKLSDEPLEVVYLEKADAFNDLLAILVERESYLKEWAAGQKKGSVGFILARPLTAVLFRDPQEKTESRVTNDLVHRLGHLLVTSAYGRQPYWLTESVAWDLEQKQEGAIYAFCHRNGFVGVKEHSGWPKIGRAWLTAGAAIPLEKILAMDPANEIPRDVAAGAMVLAGFLASKQADAWQRCLEAFRKELEARALTEAAPKIPPEKQKENFLAAFGADAARTLCDSLKRS